MGWGLNDKMNNDYLINQNMFIEWQKLCVCDFESNGNSHSKTCLERFKMLVGEYKA